MIHAGPSTGRGLGPVERAGIVGLDAAKALRNDLMA